MSIFVAPTQPLTPVVEGRIVRRWGAPSSPLALGGLVLVHRVVALVHRAGVVLLALGVSILVHRVVLLALVHRVVPLALGGSVLVHGVVYRALVG